MLVIVGASGKLGFATLSALLKHHLLPANEIVVTSSSDAGTRQLQFYAAYHVRIRHATWDDEVSFEKALIGADKLFLISSARIDKDFNNAPPGSGREADHLVALRAAKKVGVKHVYYTSLAFANPSKSNVMTAHERTEEWLRSSENTMGFTIIREGLYNESWPLYFGHYDVQKDDRAEVPVAGDGKISWTSIPDLGLANAVILAAPAEKYAGKTIYLSQERTHTLEEVAAMVSNAKGKEVKLKIVSRDEHERYYTKERGMRPGMVNWWSTTYDALKDGEAEIQDPMLENLLASRGVKPKPMEETVAEMLKTPA